MKPLDIDFAPPPPLWRQPLAWAALALLAGSIALGVQTWWMGREIAAAAASQALDNKSPATLPPTETPTLAVPAGAAELAAWARVDHAAAFASIESARVPGVRVLAIETSSVDAFARLEIELQDPADLMTYLAEINAGMPAQRRWMLMRSQSAGGHATATLRLQLGTVGERRTE